MERKSSRSLTYLDSGVNIETGNALASWIGRQAERTRRPEVVGGIGSFAGLFAMPGGLVDPLLVSCTDGVGTKLKVAFAAGRHDTVGVDLVAMSVNDVITVGAQPLFFLDYFATGKLEPEVAQQVLAGIIEGCQQAGCALLGGETAEMPGMYGAGEYDLAGFVVGVVERARLIDGSRVTAGDVVIGLPASGLHSNGYSLARRVLLGDCDEDEQRARLAAVDPTLGCTLADALLAPTRIYVSAARRLQQAVQVHALIHVTGGGLIDNPPRCLPKGSTLGFRLEVERWSVPPLMTLIAERGGVATDEMRRTFNMGLGMLAVVPAEACEAALAALADEGALAVGEIVDNARLPVELV